MSSDEECDYMSEKFLSECVSEDVRPGLLFNQRQKRAHEQMKQQARSNEQNSKRFRPASAVEAERRQEGLAQALDCSNRGFALLQKMGYKPGSAIGKTGEGRVDPINIQIKANRGGLGREAALREVAERKARLRESALLRRQKQASVEDYRARLARQQAQRQTEGDLRRSQRACQQLDTDKDIDAPSEVWFWPEVKRDKEEEEKEEEEEEEEEEEAEKDGEKPEEEVVAVEFEPAEKLDILTLYLRKAHCYCVWCGVRYEDDADLASSCPGPTRDDH